MGTDGFQMHSSNLKSMQDFQNKTKYPECINHFKPESIAKTGVGAVASSFVTSLVPAAQAIQDTMIINDGEPFIVQIGWAATCVMFTFSLSLVVRGRSGL